MKLIRAGLPFTAIPPTMPAETIGLLAAYLNLKRQISIPNILFLFAPAMAT